MDRPDALQRIRNLVGKDLRRLADDYGITVFIHGKKNKGWAGHVIEHYLGLPVNSSQSPNFGSWELKTVSLKRLKDGRLTIKETMAITMIDPYNVVRTEFEDSHLLTKLRRMIMAARVWENQQEISSVLYSVKAFDLDDPDIFRQVKEDYDTVRTAIAERGFSSLTGRMGTYIQPRTKGAGHGSSSRAFYARKSFLEKCIWSQGA